MQQPPNSGYPPNEQPPYPSPYTQYPPQLGQTPPPGYPQMPPGYPPNPNQFPSNGQAFPQTPPGYPQQLPMQQQSPKKKNKLAIGCGVVAAVVVLIALISAVSSGGKSSSTTTSSSTDNSSSSTKNSAPSQSQTWQTTHTYNGNGEKKTETITVGNDWKIQWSCTPSSFMGNTYNVIVSVYNSDGTPADYAAINTMCKDGNTSGETEEHTGGNVYLDVNSEGDWSLTIQELK